ISPRLALTLVDRMLGGRGHSVKVERHLTEIEVALLEDILRIVLEEWCGQWRHEGELHPQIIGHENNGRYLQTSPRDAIMLTATIDFEFGDCSEPVQIAIPFYTVEPLVKSMQARRHRDSSGGRPAAPAEWKEIYHHIALPARAEWDAFELSLRDLTRLRVGDVLPLPASIVDRTRVCLAGAPKFTGTVGLDGDRVVVKISDKIKPEESTHAHAH
ncbi:MAG: FliM/FliN family flagellar motor switch protein, partial [Rariglobus sp.]